MDVNPEVSGVNIDNSESEVELNIQDEPKEPSSTEYNNDFIASDDNLSQNNVSDEQDSAQYFSVSSDDSHFQSEKKSPDQLPESDISDLGQIEESADELISNNIEENQTLESAEDVNPESESSDDLSFSNEQSQDEDILSNFSNNNDQLDLELDEKGDIALDNLDLEVSDDELSELDLDDKESLELNDLDEKDDATLDNPDLEASSDELSELDLNDKKDLELNDSSDVSSDLDNSIMDQDDNSQDNKDKDLDILDDQDFGLNQDVDNLLDQKDDILISEDVEEKVSSKINDLRELIGSQDNSDLIASQVNDFIRGEIKIWFYNNLPDIVDKIVKEEISKLINKS